MTIHTPLRRLLLLCLPICTASRAAGCSLPSAAFTLSLCAEAVTPIPGIPAHAAQVAQSSNTFAAFFSSAMMGMLCGQTLSHWPHSTQSDALPPLRVAKP